MISQNQNVLEDVNIKRLIQFNPDDKQITFLDSRFYQRNGKFYPSITYILSYIPKGNYYIDWLKEQGENSDVIVQKASERGKQVHEAIEHLVKGKEIYWINDKGEAKYPLDVWQMLLRFSDFWKIHQPKLIGSEIHVFSDKYEIAGTIDLLVTIGEETWLIDVKTSNQIPKVYFYQLAAYQQCFEECFDRKIDRRGILWLKSATRKEDKTGKTIRGKNWQLIESDRNITKDFESFQLAYSMFRHEVEYDKPLTEIFPISIKLI